MTAVSPALEPEATIGILGGGQLGRMLALAAARLGFKCHVFAPNPDSPAFDVVHRVTCADYGDTEALDRFAEDVDVVTYEFENVPAEPAAFLAARLPGSVDAAGNLVLLVDQDRSLWDARLIAEGRRHGDGVSAGGTKHPGRDAGERRDHAAPEQNSQAAPRPIPTDHPLAATLGVLRDVARLDR